MLVKKHAETKRETIGIFAIIMLLQTQITFHRIMHKKQRNLFALLMTLPVFTVIASLFLPYLVKVNVQSGDLTLPNVLMGYQYVLALVILLMMLYSVYCITVEKKIFVALALSLPILFLTYFIRHSIHFQGFVDHDYDSKTGLGFLLLFLAVIVHFGICGSAFILYIRNRNAKID